MWVISRSFPERKYIPFSVVHSTKEGVAFSSLKISKYKTSLEAHRSIGALNDQPATMLNMLASPSFRITEASVRVQCIRYYSRWITKWLELVAAGRQLLQRDRRPWSCSTRSFSPRIFHATRTKEIKENKRSSKEICNVVLFQKFRTFLLNCMSNKGLYYISRACC